MTARRKHESGWSHSLSVHFEIEVPTETRTELRTGGGGITLSGLRGAAEVKTSGGPIEVTGLNGNLEAHTSGGPIRLREVTGDAHVATSGGPIDVDALEGSLQAHTSGGGIRINHVSGYVEASHPAGRSGPLTAPATATEECWRLPAVPSKWRLTPPPI